MNLALSPVILLGVLCLSHTALGTASEHYRPQGHTDITIAISPEDDAIVFNAAGSGGRDLYILHLADLKVRQIADTPEYEVDPSFSSDGKRIVYAAGVPGDRADHIFTVGADGAAKSQLTKADANDSAPRFSPDGSWVVFARDKSYRWGGLAANWDGGGVICVVGADGKGERQLTRDEGFAFAPCFSPDGKAVRYFTAEGLFSISLDGSTGPENISPLIGRASFSPDGKTLVYSEGKFSRDCELFMATLDGKVKSQITTSDNGCFHPVFANRDARVYFLMVEWPQGPSGVPQSSIWTVRTNGTEQKQITDLSMFDAPMHWKPGKSP